jgi:hypothetical protein
MGNELRALSATYSSDHRLGSQQCFVQVGVDEPLQHERSDSCYGFGSTNDGKAVGHWKRPLVVQSGEKSDAVSEGYRVVGVAQKVLGIPETESTVDLFPPNTPISRSGLPSCLIEVHLKARRSIRGIEKPCYTFLIYHP